jgi:hypothetical protein
MVGRATTVDKVHIEAIGFQVKRVNEQVDQTGFIVSVKGILQAGGKKNTLFSVFSLHKDVRNYKKYWVFPCFQAL